MALQIALVLSPEEAADKNKVLLAATRKARVDISRVCLMRIVRRSIDARRGVKINLGVELYVDNEQPAAPIHLDYKDVSFAREVVVVGSGPAGLFAALRLIERGLKPIVIERGRDVSTRKRDLAIINRGGDIDADSNYAFGEGGAGTYSDGKLYTRSKKRGDYAKALHLFCHFGASEEILFEAHPHIGTDRLPRIISSMREQIIACGGEVLFDSRLEDIEIVDNKVRGVVISKVVRQGELPSTPIHIATSAVVLATGHSARDIYELLHRKGIALEAKPFAMGVRVEHPQELIDRIQYKMPYRGNYLPAATYSLVEQVMGRGVYSFCMCPGGFIVPAMTDESESVVNGMSPSLRNSRFANSGIVTEIRLDDVACYADKFGVLAGLHFQRELERAARIEGGDRQKAPAQRLTDFVAGRLSSSLPRSSYVPGMNSSNFREWMPEFIYSSLSEGFKAFGRRLHGFLTADAVVLGVESRTSSPVRIPRDPLTLMHPQIEGLYPAGEGAGYAGGIISSGMDGEAVANRI